MKQLTIHPAGVDHKGRVIYGVHYRGVIAYAIERNGCLWFYGNSSPDTFF